MDNQTSKSEDIIVLDKYNKGEHEYEQVPRRTVDSEVYQNLKTKMNGNGDTMERKAPRANVIIIILAVLVTVLVAAVIAVTAVVAIVIKESDNFGTSSMTAQQNPASNQSAEDLLTVIADEKRLRHQLEDQLNDLGNKFNQMEQSQTEERSNRHELEAKYSNMTAELEEKNIQIDNLTSSLTEVEDQISVLKNHTAVIDQQIADQQIGNISSSGEQRTFVGFSVKMDSQSSVTTSNPLQVYSTVFNERDDFNISTGVFVCKQPGIYFFTFSFVHNHKGGISYCCVHKNGSRSPMACAIAGDTTSSRYSIGTTSGLLELKEADRVYVGECTNPEDIEGNTNLTGFLLQPK